MKLTAFTLTLFIVAARAAPVDFSRDVQPILAENCYACHGPDEKARKAKLRLDTKDGAFRTVDGITVVAPGNVAKSELITRIFSTDPDEVMPTPKSHRTLTDTQKQTLWRWVEEGAKWGEHWAFLPPVRPAVPTGSAHPVDAFVLQKLAEEKLAPAPEAAPERLIRRMTLDLTGLPPTPDEVAAFVQSANGDRQRAAEALADRLLASSRFGERMVWDWLDVARYADSHGYQADTVRAAWPWRDWAVRAFNADMPFDRFTLEQLAGDLLPDATTDQRLATAFLRLHMVNGEGGRIPEENRVEYLFDQTETIGTAWLGLTVGCARCHDHKFDPTRQRDYYALLGFLNNTPVSGGGAAPAIEPVLDLTGPEHAARLKAADERIAAVTGELEPVELAQFPRAAGEPATATPRAAELPGNVVTFILSREPAMRPVDRLVEAVIYYRENEPAYAALLERLKNSIAARQTLEGLAPKVMVMAERDGAVRENFILNRGAYDQPGERVVAATPAFLPALAEGEKPDRLALARWLCAPENPLTARVFVNRVWQMLFGVGLVKTAEDFGVQGEKPSHPELLDWLAVEFRESGWKVKPLIRQIVTSAAYRQSSVVPPGLAERDPENRLLARGPRHRLPSWMLRDQALALSGLLVEKVGGEPVRSYQPPGVWEDASFGTISYEQDHGDALHRRSVYLFWRRIVAPTVFFDVATRQSCTVRTARTSTPLHALITLNDTVYVEAARALAQIAMQQHPDGDARIAAMFRRCTARAPREYEITRLRAAAADFRAHYARHPEDAAKLLAIGESPRDLQLPATEHAAQTALALVLLNLDETLSKE